MSIKTVYLYNAITNYFEGEKIVAEKDNVPVNSTVTPMELEYKEHWLPTWTGESWIYTENPNNPVPVYSTPPESIPEPTLEEIKKRKLDELDEQYISDKNELLMYYIDALVNDDKDEQTAIKEELITLNEKFDTDYEAIINNKEE